MDMVDVDDSGQIRVMHPNPSKIDLRYAWISAIWTSKLSHFMHDYLSTRVDEDKPAQRELSAGVVLQAAIE